MLLQLPKQIFMPQAVEQEIFASPAGDPAKKFLQSGEIPVEEVFVLSEILPSIT